MFGEIFEEFDQGWLLCFEKDFGVWVEIQGEGQSGLGGFGRPAQIQTVDQNQQSGHKLPKLMYFIR